jgi:plastocyanin
MRRFAISLFIALAAISLAACGGGSSPTPPSSQATTPSAAAGSAAAPSAAGGSAAAGAACAVAPSGTTAAATVSIKDFKFSPSPVQAKVGEAIEWKNDDTAPHSATMDDNACDTDSIDPGSSAMLVFTAAGTYKYHCKIHPGQMKDVTVEVK